MKHKIFISLIMTFLLAFVMGCGRDNEIYIEQTEDTSSEYVGDVAEAVGETLDVVAAEAQSESLSPEMQDGLTDSNQDGATWEVEQESEACYVYVCGAVEAPGVYMLNTGDRIYEAIALAGGLTEDASTAAVNQAETVSDGQMIFVPTIEEAEAGIGVISEVSGAATSEQGTVSDGKVNLNTASLTELMTLPGIGESKAQSILDYRAKNGGFSSVEEIMNVDGIKEGLYNRIKDSIKVK